MLRLPPSLRLLVDWRLPADLHLSPVWKIRMVCLLTSVGIAFTLLLSLRHPAAEKGAPKAAGNAKPAASTTAAATTAPAAMPGSTVSVSLGDALGRNWVTALFRGNGRDEIVATVANKSGRPLRVTFSAGTRAEQLGGQAARRSSSPATARLIFPPAMPARPGSPRRRRGWTTLSAATFLFP